MEFPILLELPLPETCRKIVTQFLRPIHPTARLINALTFQREAQYDVVNSSTRFFVTGPGVRIIDPMIRFFRNAWSITTPCYVFSDRVRFVFIYSEITGEHRQDGAEDDDSEENADSDSDEGESLGSEFLNSDGELAGFRD